MKIYTLTDPNYFKFCFAMCKSIRINKNDHEIIVDLMDFDEIQKFNAVNLMKEKIGGKLRFINTSSKRHLSEEENKEEFYRNHRVVQFLKLLEEDDRDLCTFGANGIIRTKLDYLEDLIKDNHFIFMERPRSNRFSFKPEKIEGVYELGDMIREHNLIKDIDDIIQTHTGRCVLLGTHVIKNCEKSINIVKDWQKELDSFKDSYRKKFCDMDFFVKSLILDYYNTGKKLNLYTAKNIPQEFNTLCDCTFSDTSLVWFAKGPSKFQNKKYINLVDHLTS